MNVNISAKPNKPNFLKFTAHGYINMISTSNKTNKTATKKYLIENGVRALPCTSIPHSKGSDFTFDFLCGPIQCVANIVATTKPSATIIISKIGIYVVSTIVIIFCKINHKHLKNLTLFGLSARINVRILFKKNLEQLLIKNLDF